MKAAAVLGLILLGIACNKTPVSYTHEVAMQDFSFAPESTEVAVGDTVTWVNRGAVEHSTTSGEVGSPDGKWDSGLLATGGSFAYVFTTAGNFHYYCRLHGAMGMKGVISAR